MMFQTHWQHHCMLNSLLNWELSKISFTLLPSVMGIDRPPVDSPRKGQVMQKAFQCHNVFMRIYKQWLRLYNIIPYPVQFFRMRNDNILLPTAKLAMLIFIETKQQTKTKQAIIVRGTRNNYTEELNHLCPQPF